MKFVKMINQVLTPQQNCAFFKIRFSLAFFGRLLSKVWPGARKYSGNPEPCCCCRLAAKIVHISTQYISTVHLKSQRWRRKKLHASYVLKLFKYTKWKMTDPCLCLCHTVRKDALCAKRSTQEWRCWRQSHAPSWRGSCRCLLRIWGEWKHD